MVLKYTHLYLIMHSFFRGFICSVYACFLDCLVASNISANEQLYLNVLVGSKVERSVMTLDPINLPFYKYQIKMDLKLQIK